MSPDELFDEERYRPTPDDALPAADLTELLVQASANRAYQPELYRRLLTDSLVILVQEWPESEQMGSGQQIPITPLFLQTGELPVFTGREVLFVDPNMDPETTPHVLVNGRDLLTMMRQRSLHLNPFTAPSLVLAPQFVEQLLAGNYPGQEAAGQMETLINEEEVVDELERVPLELAPLAEQLSEQLALLFRQHPRVRQAYLVWQRANEELPESCFAVYVEIAGANERLVQEMVYVAKNLLNEARLNLRIFFNPDPEYLGSIAEQLQLAPFYQD